MNGEQLTAFFNRYTQTLKAASDGMFKPVSLGTFPATSGSTVGTAELRFEGKNHLLWLYLRGGNGGADAHLTTLNTFRLIQQMNTNTQAAKVAADRRHQVAAASTQPAVVRSGPSGSDVALAIMMGLAGAADRYQTTHRAWQARWENPVISESAPQYQLRPTNRSNYSDGQGNIYYSRNGGSRL